MWVDNHFKVFKWVKLSPRTLCQLQRSPCQPLSSPHYMAWPARCIRKPSKGPRSSSHSHDCVGRSSRSTLAVKKTLTCSVVSCSKSSKGQKNGLWSVLKATANPKKKNKEAFFWLFQPCFVSLHLFLKAINVRF